MFETMREAFRRATRRRMAMIDHETLRSMDDHLLRDIGVTRAQIDAASPRRGLAI
jgi:uncharacterized protein YjiS (DUF1127 family)